jgi:hypothetical protein
VARLAVRTAALAIARNWAAATELGLTIGGHFEGRISLELDMMPSHRTSYPLIRHLRLYAVPKMVLERDFVEVRDELGLIKILMQLVSKDTMIKHIEKAVNQVMGKHLLQEGWRIGMRVPAHMLPGYDPRKATAAAGATAPTAPTASRTWTCSLRTRRRSRRPPPRCRRSCRRGTPMPCRRR